jgi:hypothetical protein
MMSPFEVPPRANVAGKLAVMLLLLLLLLSDILRL